MPRDRKGRFTVTARRTTTVAEEVTVTEDAADTAPIVWAAGFSRGFGQPAQQWNAQRRQQVWRASQVVVAAAESGARVLDDGTLRQAVNILRALPGATPLELTLGRST